jgi:predicted nucleic acid-binding protein
LGYLLVTNVISEARKSRADNSGVMAFLLAAGLFLSVLTSGEFRNGVVAKRHPSPADQLGV